MIDSRHHNDLPDIATLRRLCQSLAMLDAVLSPEWDYRYYSFNAEWSEGRMTASMRNGSGDEYYILFNQSGVIIKGYAHESLLAQHYVRHGVSYPGVVDRIPTEFADFRDEPAFEPGVATFCLWRRNDDHSWQSGTFMLPHDDDPDGSAELLRLLDGNPATYRDWAQKYFGSDGPEPWEIPLESIERIYRQEPLSEGLVTMLNPRARLDDLAEDIREIAYPRT